MARYIDADALLKSMQRRYDEICDTYGYHDLYASGYDDAVDAVENAPTADVAPRAEVAREIFEVIAKMFFEKQKQYENSHQSGKARQMMVARFEVYKLKKKYAEPEPPKGG